MLHYRSSPARVLTPLALLISIGIVGVSCTALDAVDPARSSAEASAPRATRALAIPPKAQQTQVWCWAATAQMVFEHYRMPNLNPGGDYQCGIVGAYGVMVQGVTSPCYSNCYACISTIGNLAELHRLVTQYGAVAQAAGRASRVLSAQMRASALSYAELAGEIDADRPVVAGVSFGGLSLPGVSAHAVLLVGYDNRDGRMGVIVNDPYPYQAVSLSDPYLQAGAQRIALGQYVVPHATLVGRLTWGNTIWKIQ